MTDLTIKIQDRKGIVWQGEGSSCSMVNESGPFDILSEHTQFVTPIKDQIIVRDAKLHTVYELALDSSALCRIKSNTVEIWLAI